MTSNTMASCGCGTVAQADVLVGRTIVVQFLELDMSRAGATSCATCTSTEAQLDAVIARLQPVLAEVGTGVIIEKMLIQSLEQAHALRFAASPTIRVAGHDIVPSRGDLFGFGERFWDWHGQSFSSPPPAAIIDAVLRAYSDDASPASPTRLTPGLPDELVSFFAGSSNTGPSSSTCGCS
ncbi:DUF2703 domain-containing protein [Scytonema tolypothrichoides VB-61278]|nr:DUF2703 domain-containing protein [Scytonema tolypothrichoides VB-61278]